eukprot:6788390-Prymnesium_polylepis.1
MSARTPLRRRCAHVSPTCVWIVLRAGTFAGALETPMMSSRRSHIAVVGHGAMRHLRIYTVSTHD